MHDETREVPALTMRASFSPGSVNEKARTVELVWTTGARVLRGYYDRFWEELSLDPKHVRMGRLNNGAPFLEDHAGYSVAAVRGVVESAKLDGKRGTAVVRFAKAEDDPEADKIFRKVKDGIIQNVSVGYRVHKLEKVEDGDDKIPVYRATDWEPYEISAVAMGADDGAGFRSEKAEQPNPCIFISRGTPQEESSAMNETEKKAADDAKAAEAAEQKRMADQKAVEAKAALAERERAAGIRHAVRAAKLDESLAEELVSKGTALDAARALVLDKLATASESVRTEQHTVQITDDAKDKFLRGATAWLLEKGGARGTVERAVKAGALPSIELDPGEFRGMSLLELAKECLRRRGVKTTGMDKMKIVAEAFTRASGYGTTSDFAVLFENVMHKTLLGAYAVTPDTWSRFCKVETVPDFRPSNRFRTGSFGSLDSLNEHGEFKNKSIPDGQKTAISVATKGNMIALSRQAIINDDMSALSDLTQKLGRAARLSIEQDVYALLLENSGLGPTQSDSAAFFHANRANVGSSSALSVAGIDADRVVMAQQMDISSNDYLDLRPAILLVPVGLGGAARVLNDAQYDHDDTKLQKPNRVRGLFRDVIDTPRLSGTRRYLFADPSVAPAIVVAFLEGQGQAPVLESQDGWRVDGTEWKVRLDYMAQMFDPKGAVTNAGT